LYQITVNASNLGPIRFVPWLPYPRLGVAALDAPSGDALCGFRTEEELEFPLNITCNSGVISEIQFASFGTPTGFCNDLQLGACHSANSQSVVSSACLGKPSCQLLSNSSFFGGDPCVGTAKWLSVQVACSAPTNNTYWDFAQLDPAMEDFMNASNGYA
jgi:hypothetical protein